MRKTQYKVILSVIVFTSMLMTGISIDAAPVKFKQVVQVVNIKPGKAATGSFSKLRLGGNSVYANDGDDDSKDGDGNKKSARKSPQDDRVITTTTEEIVENEQCDCTEAIAVTKGGGFPKWPLFGLAAVPLAFIRTGGGDNNNAATPTPTLILTPTPTTSVTPTGTPPTTPTVTPTTPTVTPTVTPTTPTPTVTPPPPTVTPPAPVPEPMTLLLFGTGLASVGFATRKKFGRKGEKEENNS